MGCMNAKSVAPLKPNPKRITPLDLHKKSQNENDHISSANNLTQNLESSRKPKKHYVPKQKKRVLETVTIKQAKDQEGNKMINNYVFMDTLGKGSYGKVKLAQHRSEEKKNLFFAIKILKKSFLKRKREYYRDAGGVMKFKDALDNVKREIAIMKKLTHPNVIRLYEVIENPENDKLYMVLDFANGGQLIEWDEDEEKFFFCNPQQNEPFTEKFLRDFFRGCLKGLHYLHSHGIVHRDIKPQNILLDSQERPKLADFGVSSVIQDGSDRVSGNEGTYFFMPPEALSKESSKAGYNGKMADIWSLGVTFFCCTFLELPFLGANLNEIFEVIQTKALTFPSHRECSDGLKNLFKIMIEKDPTKRATIQQIAANEWINQGYENQSLAKEFENVQQVIEEVNQTEIENALQISTVVRIKAWVARWKETHTSRVQGEDPMKKSSLGAPPSGLAGGEPSTALKGSNSGESNL